MAKREEQLLYDKSANNIHDLYHHPDGFYALDVMLNLIQKQSGLKVDRVHKEGLSDPKGKIYLIVSGAHYRCVLHDEDGRWVIKDNHRTFPIVNSLSQFLISQHASSAVYVIGNHFTKNDLKSTNERERPKHSPVKALENPGEEGKSPAPQRQKTMKDFFQPLEGEVFRAETNSRPSKSRSLATAETNVNIQPIFNPIAKGFSFIPKEMSEEAQMFHNWLMRKQEDRRTPVKATVVLQNLHAENMLPPSLESSSQNENLEILLQNMTPNSRSSAKFSQDLLQEATSQHSNNLEAVSQQLLSQSAHLSPSKHIHPERLHFDTPSQNPATPIRRSERIAQRAGVPDQSLPTEQKFQAASAQAVGKTRGKRPY
uniref:Uncharacterized protein n=1 Tax=Eutreptiella gymnastica TaxID=73025 RepID=A0A6U8MRL3_9EUGL|mmetsp:Transcript_85153/g.149026  ORF Transcript_85153/g.149026 Transcript_85153/m.149026 type:complete len:370 (+) Transcript_85153:247-1356(+)